MTSIQSHHHRILVDMGLLLFLSFSLLLSTVSPLRDISKSSCSSNFEEVLDQMNHTGVLRLPLHHPHSPCSPAPRPPLPFSDVLTHDDARVRSLAARLSKTSSSSKISATSSSLLDPTTSSSVPLSPGTSIGVGNYITRIGLGSPSSSYAMVVDTGSSLTWLQCSPCVVSCHAQAGPIYNPSSSSTYRPVPCSATECSSLQSATLNPSACSKSNVCIYEASYGDSSFSVGYLSQDTLFFNSQTFPSFVYGCGQDNEGLFGRSAGLIGLARNKLSLLSQLSPRLGYSFSYCLPTPSSAGFLSIGAASYGGFSYTPLVSSSLDSSLYFVRLVAINVAGKALPISASAFSSTPTIIDSGTVITRLPSDVYSALSKAVAGAVRGAARASAFSILDTCFKGSLTRLAVPAVDLVFQGGAALRLQKNNVFINVDSSTTCLAFAPAGSVAIIGNTQQQTFTVVYDVGASKLGFAPGGCR